MHLEYTDFYHFKYNVLYYITNLTLTFLFRIIEGETFLVIQFFLPKIKIIL